MGDNNDFMYNFRLSTVAQFLQASVEDLPITLDNLFVDLVAVAEAFYCRKSHHEEDRPDDGYQESFVTEVEKLDVLFPLVLNEIMEWTQKGRHFLGDLSIEIGLNDPDEVIVPNRNYGIETLYGEFEDMFGGRMKEHLVWLQENDPLTSMMLQSVGNKTAKVENMIDLMNATTESVLPMIFSSGIKPFKSPDIQTVAGHDVIALLSKVPSVFVMCGYLQVDAVVPPSDRNLNAMLTRIAMMSCGANGYVSRTNALEDFIKSGKDINKGAVQYEAYANKPDVYRPVWEWVKEAPPND